MTAGGAAQTDGSANAGGDTGDTPPFLPLGGCEGSRWDEASFQAIYEVGPDQEYATPSEVPWESIEPGTLVKIHYRSEPYRDKWVLDYNASADAPVVVLGVPDNGALPVISGDDAVTRTELDFPGDERAIIKVGNSNVPDNGTPSNISIECLDIMGAKPGYHFTNDAGDASEYAQNASTIYIETGRDISIKNCVLHDAANGLFSASQSSGVLVSGNYIFDNGIEGSVYEHNSYTESAGITFEFNHYGSLCQGCLGNNLKDRSAGTVIRYNWIENGNRQLDLVETDHESIASLPSYRETFVYGNVLVEGDGEGNSQILHYGGDGEGDYRNGVLHFYYNTVVSTRAGNTTLARLSSNDESLEARYNVFFATAGGSSFAILDETGSAHLEGNFLPNGWRPSHGSLVGSLDLGSNTEGSDPGFVDALTQDFGLARGGAATGIAAALGDSAEPFPVTLEYRKHQAADPRLDLSDAGAFAAR